MGCSCLKGLWINGEGDSENTSAVQIHLWDSTEAPTAPVEGDVYYLIQACPSINAEAVNGQMWQYKNEAWVEYAGDVMAAA